MTATRSCEEAIFAPIDETVVTVTLRFDSFYGFVTSSIDYWNKSSIDWGGFIDLQDGTELVTDEGELAQVSRSMHAVAAARVDRGRCRIATEHQRRPRRHASDRPTTCATTNRSPRDDAPNTTLQRRMRERPNDDARAREERVCARMSAVMRARATRLRRATFFLGARFSSSSA